MLSLFIAGVTLLLILLLGSHWLINADPRTLVRWGKRIALGLGAIVLIVVVASGRAALLAALLPLLLPFLAGRRPVGRFGKSKPTPGQTSQVDTDHLNMTLDHDSGQLDGTVRQGRFAGRQLADLTLDDLRTLLSELQSAGDADSERLLTAYLDRIHPDWRDQHTTPPPSDGPMTADDARAILGVPPHATADDIEAAWRRLMKVAHPDHGGSDALASQINEARRVLLGK